MIAELKHKIKSQKSIIDEAFNPSRSNSYNLIIELSDSGFNFTVFDSISKKYIAFENYTFNTIVNTDLISDLLAVAEKESKLFSIKYKSVHCSIINNLSTLVPNALFEEENRKTYLKFNSNLEGDEFVLVNSINSIDSKNVFALPLSFKIKMDSLFNNVSYHHFSSALIDDLTNQNKNVDSKKAYINVNWNHFEILIFEKQKLIFYNSFQYTNAEDFIYFLLFALEQLSLNPENVELFLLGNINKTDAIYSITYKYIKHLKFGSRVNESDYCYQLQSLPKHEYFTLFSPYYL